MTKLAKLAKSTLSLSSLPSLPCKFFFNGAPENFNFWGEQRHKSPVNLAERY